MPWKLRKKLRSTRKFICRKTTRQRGRCKGKMFQLPTTVTVLGETSSGKTSICRKLSCKTFPDGFERATEYYNLDVILTSEGITCKHELSLHDTPGSLRETFPQLYENVIRKSDTFILVFSLASSTGISVVYRTLNDLKNIKGKQVPILVVANKSDLESKQEGDIKKRFQLYRDLSTLNIPIIEMNSKQSLDSGTQWIPLLTDIEERHDVSRGRDPKISAMIT